MPPADHAHRPTSSAGHAHRPADPGDPQAFWEDHYERQRERFRGTPNALATAHLEDLAPGTALELGSGQGADAIWLALRGWTVTALELSEVALRLARDRAEAAGVADRVTWRQHDLTSGLPDGSFDLVLSSYTQSPLPFGRTAVLRAAADRVAPGGALLVVGHSGIPSWATGGPPPGDLPVAAALIDALALPADGWSVDRREDVAREITSPDGEPGVRQDSVVRFRRR